MNSSGFILTSFFGSPGMLRLRAAIDAGAPIEVPPSTVYAILRAYYESNGLYDQLVAALKAEDIYHPAVKGLRNPTHSVVEAYVDLVWPGDLPDALPINLLAGANPKIIEAIHLIWQWSNWADKKQEAMRFNAMYGDLWLEAAVTADRERVYFHVVEPQHVTDFDEDERGYLTYVRIDVPSQRRLDNGKVELFTLTKVWRKDSVKEWEHDKGAAAEIEQLGTPKRIETDLMKAYGIDFIPIVHSRFKSTGDKRGAAAILFALDEIDDLNEAVTRLHQMLFRYNRVFWMIQANAVDPLGRPLPAPRIGAAADEEEDGDGDLVEVGDDLAFRLPGNSSMTAAVPDVNYADALAILQDDMLALERKLPELRYARLAESSDLSGVAIDLLLSATIAKVIEVRGNSEAALVRINQMCLTIGAKYGLFKDIGDYASGAFAHAFVRRRVIPLTAGQVAELLKALKDAGVALRTGLRWLGYTEEEITKVEREAATESTAKQVSLATALTNAQRQAQMQFDQGRAATVLANTTSANGAGEQASA